MSAASARTLPTTNLAQLGLDAARSLLQRMLDSADDVLFDLSERSDSDTQRRSYFDAMRLLRKAGPGLQQEFARAVESGLPRDEPRQIDLQALSLRDDEAVEADISTAKIASRVESAAASELWELRLRAGNLPPDSGLRDLLERLRPDAMAQAFRHCLQGLLLASDVRLVVFKLFERQFSTHAQAFYETLNRALEQAGYKLAAAIHTPARAPRPSAPAPAPHYRVGPRVPERLLAGAAPTETPARLQRLSLVSQWFEETAARWTSPEREQFLELLAPASEVALADPSFFQDAGHPLRQALTGLTPATPDRAPHMLAQLAASISQLRSRSTAGGDPGPVLEALDGRDLARFLAARRPDTATDAESRLRLARERAEREVRMAGSGRDLPAGLGRFLGEAWVPMAGALFLRYGEGSAEWHAAQRFLARLFAACRWAQGPEFVDEILDDMLGALQALHVPGHLSDRAVRLLREGLGRESDRHRALDLESLRPRDVDAADAANDGGPGTPPSAEDLSDWRDCLPFGAWFRVYDRDAERTQWASAGVFYPQSAQLQFSGFDPHVRVRVARPDFVSDLRSGRAEAVDPTPVQSAAIRRLCGAS